MHGVGAAVASRVRFSLAENCQRIAISTTSGFEPLCSAIKETATRVNHPCVLRDQTEPFSIMVIQNSGDYLWQPPLIFIDGRPGSGIQHIDLNRSQLSINASSMSSDWQLFRYTSCGCANLPNRFGYR